VLFSFASRAASGTRDDIGIIGVQDGNPCAVNCEAPSGAIVAANLSSLRGQPDNG